MSEPIRPAPIMKGATPKDSELAPHALKYIEKVQQVLRDREFDERFVVSSQVREYALDCLLRQTRPEKAADLIIQWTSPSN